MPHQAFISYAQKDKNAADAVVAHLERSGIPCWIAPRDVLPGANWPEAIVNAINQCRVLILVFSSHANASEHVRREVELAVKRGVPVVPVRIEDAVPAGLLEFFLSTSHWMDAMSPPIERHLDVLASKLHILLAPDAGAAARTGPSQPDRAVAPQSKRATMVRSWIQQRPGAAVALASAAALIVIVVLIAFLTGGGPDSSAEGALAQGSSRVLATDTAPIPGDARDAAAGASDPAFLEDLNAYEAEWRKGKATEYFIDQGPLRYRAWLREAESGHALAQYFVAMCVYEGAGVEQSYDKAREWLERSADGGFLRAVTALGYMHSIGAGSLPQNDEAAVTLFKDAANKGERGAMFNLAWAYRWGRGGVAQDGKAALQLYERAAGLGSSSAMRMIGELHTYGAPGVPKDAKQASVWYEMAAEAGDETARGILAAMQFADALDDYLEPSASETDRRLAEMNARKAIDPLRGAPIQAMLALLGHHRMINAEHRLQTIADDDPMRRMHRQLVTELIDTYRYLRRGLRQDHFDQFSRIVRQTVTAWFFQSEHPKVADVCSSCFKGIELGLLTQGERDELVRLTGVCVRSMVINGQYDEAARLMDDMLALADSVLRERPWDWYLKDAVMYACFRCADAFAAAGDDERSQSLLKRAWTTAFSRRGMESWLDGMKRFPPYGSAPQGMSESEAEEFSKFDKEPRLTQLTIRCVSDGESYEFHVFLIDGKHCYAQLLEQFRWVREYRGIEIPAEPEFRRLYEIARENNVSFFDLVIYARSNVEWTYDLGAADTSETN